MARACRSLVSESCRTHECAVTKRVRAVFGVVVRGSREHSGSGGWMGCAQGGPVSVKLQMGDGGGCVGRGPGRLEGLMCG